MKRIKSLLYIDLNKQTKLSWLIENGLFNSDTELRTKQVQNYDS